MKLYFLIFIIAFILFSCNKDEVATDQQYAFIKFYGMGSSSEGYDIIQLKDDCYLLFGTCTTADSGTDLFLTKINKYGNEVWKRNYGTKSNEKGYCMKLLQDEELVMMGTVEVSNTTEGSKTNIILMKTNLTGDSVVWKRQFISDTSVVAYDMQVTSTGEFVIAGTAQVSTESHSIMLKTNSSGNLIQQYFVGYQSSTSSLVVTDNSVIMIGTAYNQNNPAITGGKSVIFLLKTNSYLFPIVTFYSKGESIEKGECIKLLSDGSYICLSDSADKLCLSKFRNEKEEYLIQAWQKIFTDIGISESIDLEISSDNEYLIACTTNDENDKNIFVLNVDSTGNRISTTKTYRGEGNQICNKVIKTSEGGYAIIGTNEYSGYSVISLFKIKSNGGFK